MTKTLTLSLIVLSSLCFGQISAKKLAGKWVTCAKIDALSKLDTITFLKEDASVVNACIEKNCVYSRWDFETKDSEPVVNFYRQAGCKDAASVSEKNFSGKWSLEKDKKLIIFDDHFTKHVFKVESFTEKEMKLKKES